MTEVIRLHHWLTHEVDCPKCKAVPGRHCTITFDGETITMWTPCEERIDAAKARPPR